MSQGRCENLCIGALVHRADVNSRALLGVIGRSAAAATTTMAIGAGECRSVVVALRSTVVQSAAAGALTAPWRACAAALDWSLVAPLTAAAAAAARVLLDVAHRPNISSVRAEGVSFGAREGGSTARVCALREVSEVWRRLFGGSRRVLASGVKTVQRCACAIFRAAQR